MSLWSLGRIDRLSCVKRVANDDRWHSDFASGLETFLKAKPFGDNLVVFHGAHNNTIRCKITQKSSKELVELLKYIS